MRPGVLPRLVIVMVILSTNLGAHPSVPNVKLSGFLEYDWVIPGQWAHGVFEVKLPAGFHVNSNVPLDEFLKPTLLKLAVPPGIKVDNVIYPEPLLFKTSFSNDPIAVYEQRFLIGTALKLDNNLEPGDYSLSAQLKYQACTIKVCYPPTTRSTNITLTVSDNPTPSTSGHARLFESVGFPTNPNY
jgi:thiol:disulfide interchange protein DsbD